MLALLIEICLISKAWKKGWRGWALLPVAIGWAFCFMVGLAVGATGGSVDAVFGISLLAEVGIITVLAVMAAKERQRCLPPLRSVLQPSQGSSHGYPGCCCGQSDEWHLVEKAMGFLRTTMARSGIFLAPGHGRYRRNLFRNPSRQDSMFACSLALGVKHPDPWYRALPGVSYVWVVSSRRQTLAMPPGLPSHAAKNSTAVRVERQIIHDLSTGTEPKPWPLGGGCLSLRSIRSRSKSILSLRQLP